MLPCLKNAVQIECLGCGFQEVFAPHKEILKALKMYPAILPRFSRNFGFNWIDSTEITKIELLSVQHY
jgi:hypothetical protein